MGTRSAANQSDGTGKYFMTMHARRQQTTTTTPFDLWGPGGFQPTEQPAGVVSMVSSSANDTAAGTGARTVLLRGVDADYFEVSETVTLNGTTPVASTTQMIWVNDAHVTSTGTLQRSAGTIDISIGGVNIDQIEPDRIIDSSAVVVWPREYAQGMIQLLEFSITSLSAAGGNDSRAELCFDIRPSLTAAWDTVGRYGVSSNSGTVQIKLSSLAGIIPGGAARIRCNRVIANTGILIATANIGDGWRP